MLDGLEATEIRLSEVKAGYRIDAEMYQKPFVQAEKLITRRRFTILGNEVSSIKKGIFDINAGCYSESGIPFVRILNLKHMITDEDDLAFIPESEHLKNQETALRKNDVVLSKTAYAAASVVTFQECNTSQDTIAIKLNDQSQISSQYVVAFLNTKHGLSQMRRWFTGNIQMHLNLTDCRNLPISVFNQPLQLKIKELFNKSIRLKDRSKGKYAEAESLLLNELGLKDWQPSDENIAIKSFANSFGSTTRLDAEYYQPKYDELISGIRHNADHCRFVNDFSVFNQRGEQPVYVEDGELCTINSKHILERHLDYDNFERTKSEEWDLKPEARVFKNDILIYTTGANVGRANVYLKDEKALASNHVNIVRLREKEESPLYVGFVLNSLVGRMQTRRLITGSAQAELYPSAIGQFIVPFISPEKQKAISTGLENSYITLCDSRRLLDVAKRGVEIAIEQNEKTAVSWMENELSRGQL